jgi:hypothetical protein
MVALRVDAPDLAGPWKLVVTNQGEVPVRFAADGRLLTLELPKPEDPYAPVKGNPKAPPPRPAPPIICKLPAELRPSGVVENRAVLLGPGARYEEVFSPALYCFSDASAKALVPGASVIAKLGFLPPTAKGKKNAPPPPPFVVEPALRNPPVSAIKELVSEPFILPAAAPVSSAPAPSPMVDDDPNGPSLELIAPARVDSHNELTIGMTLTVKNVGGRAVSMHMRRDNFMFDVDGPGGSANCGQPAEGRKVPRDGFTPLGTGASRTIDVWIGEMCPDLVFDRPGLYRIRPSLAFPSPSETSTVKIWTRTVSAKDAVLVRVREGRLPFYTSAPQVFGDAR